MKKRNLAFMIPISMLSLGCSTDDVANIITGEEAVTLSGKVIDGYISGANVFIDLNNNGEFDSGEPFAMSDENGTYTIETDLESGDFQVIAEGGVDIVTGETFDGTLRTVFNRDESNISGIVISPVTTLVAEEFSLNRDDGLTGAKDKIATNFKIDPKDIDRDFIKDENFDLFTLNQNIINEVERLSIYAEESNSSDDYTRSAIQTILETSSFDQTTNIEKLSEKLAVTIARNSDTSLDGEEAMAPSSELDSNQTVDDRFEGLTFDEKIKIVQDENRDELNYIRDNIGDFVVITRPQEPLPVDPENPDVGEQNRFVDEIKVLKSEIDAQYSSAMENSGDSTLDIPLKLASVIDLDTQEYKSQALRNLQSIEDDSFKYIEEALSIDFENRLQEFHQSVDMNFQNSRSELISRIEEISKTAPTSLTQLPYTETTSYGDEVTYTLSANETTSLTVDITVTNENGTQLSGVGKASLNGETIYEDESSYLDLSGKLVGDMYDLNISTIKDGIEGSGTIYGENSATIEAKELKIGVANRYVGVVESGEYHFEGEIEGNIEHSYLNGEISKDDFNFKGEIETTFMFYDYGTTSSDSSMIDESEKVLKSEDVSILGVGTDLISQYATDEDMAENESMEDMIYTTAEDYIEDGNFSSIVDEYGEEAQAYINDGLETIEDYENLISNREINTLYINGTVINGDRETTLTLKEDMKSISISNLSMKFGDEATLSFENATIDGIVTTYLSDSGVAISYPETSTDGVEDMLLRRAIKSDADFPQVPTVQPELQDEDIVTTTAVLEDSGDIPPALPDNAGEGTDVTDPNTVIVHEPIEEPMPKPIVDIVNSPAVNISNINLSVNSEFGEFNFAGSYSIAEGFVRREGVSTLDEVKVDGIIMGALADENSIISQDIVLTTEDVTDLKFRVADIDGEVGMTLGFEDGYQIFIKDNHTNLTAVDSNGGTFETTSIAE